MFGLKKSCNHKWKLISKTYRAPYNVSRITNFGTITPDAFCEIMEMQYKAEHEANRDVTSFLFQCENCMALKTEVLPGKEVGDE